MSSASLAWGTPALTAPSTGRVLTTWILQPVSGCRHAVQRVRHWRIAHLCSLATAHQGIPPLEEAPLQTSSSTPFWQQLCFRLRSSLPQTRATWRKTARPWRSCGWRAWRCGTRRAPAHWTTRAPCRWAQRACVRLWRLGRVPLAMANSWICTQPIVAPPRSMHSMHYALPSSWRYAITPKCHATLHSNAAAPHQSGGRQLRHPYWGWSGGSSEAPAGEGQLALLRASRPQCVPGMRSLDQVCWSLTISHNPSPLCRPPCRCRF